MLAEALEMKEQLEADYRFLHKNAETGFSILKTFVYVEERLKEMGCVPKRCGRAGIVVYLGPENAKDCILLRADMDGLPIKEETGKEYACQSGNMHACGHDMHTAMLLGAAGMLKKREKELTRVVQLMFQPAEEILEGAKDMLQEGILNDPPVKKAMMLHVMVSVPWDTGTAIVSSPGISAPAADYFKMQVKGKGCHGSSPWEGVDPITIAAHILMGLQEITSREIATGEGGVLTIGSIHGGNAANVIPESVVIEGSLRALSDDLREKMKQRILEVSQGIAGAMRGEIHLEFPRGCPTLKNDKEMSQKMTVVLKQLLGPDKVCTTAELGEKKGGGSEDFAYVSQEVPSIMVALAAGKRKEGYDYPLHHPKATFDMEALPYGSAIYTETALRLS